MVHSLHTLVGESHRGVGKVPRKVMTSRNTRFSQYYMYVVHTYEPASFFFWGGGWGEVLAIVILLQVLARMS